MMLFVGLGNPTDKYQNTRHNFGFMVLDKFISSHEATFVNKPKFQGSLFKAENFLALKPTTFMNHSGLSVKAVKDFYKPKQVVVVHDDLDLPLGSIRFKQGGSSGGHNGLKSIDENITQEYIRIRLGIGKPAFKTQVINFVLEDFSEEEKDCVEKVVSEASGALEMLLGSSYEEVRAKFTNKKGLCS